MTARKKMTDAQKMNAYDKVRVRTNRACERAYDNWKRVCRKQNKILDKAYKKYTVTEK